jgi:hypothetical protein
MDRAKMGNESVPSGYERVRCTRVVPDLLKKGDSYGRELSTEASADMGLLASG